MEIIVNKRTNERLEMPDGSWELMQSNGLSRSHRLLESTSLKPKIKDKDIKEFLEPKKEIKIEEKIEPIKEDKKKTKIKTNGRKDIIDESVHEDFKQE